MESHDQPRPERPQHTEIIIIMRVCLTLYWNGFENFTIADKFEQCVCIKLYVNFDKSATYDIEMLPCELFLYNPSPFSRDLNLLLNMPKFEDSSMPTRTSYACNANPVLRLHKGRILIPDL